MAAQIARRAKPQVNSLMAVKVQNNVCALYSWDEKYFSQLIILKDFLYCKD